MQIVEFIKNDISSLTKITLEKLNQSFGVLKAGASTEKPEINTSSSNFHVEDTRVFCIVNKYNEVVKASSRFFYSNTIKSKPIYCLFLSKQDAIDFMYKVANTEPSAFKRSGLGINSFSLKGYFNLVDKNKNSSEVILVSDLKELEKVLTKSKPSSKEFNYVISKSVNFDQPFKGLLAYQVNPSYKDNPFSNTFFLTIEDATNKWYSFIEQNDNIPKKFKKPTVFLSTLSLEQVRKMVY